ncbi:MAG: MarR family transcriptional regulator [Acidobacteria bacterium]|nr:MarR family transcriptional regulator [Acidobacteriota bacterium]
MKKSAAVDLATLMHAAASAQDDVETKLGAIGLSWAKLAALKALSDAGASLPLTQLADRLSCVKSNITQLVDRLEADGFVERQANPSDRRARLATLTAAGQKACREGSRVLEAAERSLLGTLSASESRQLAELLAKIQRR